MTVTEIVEATTLNQPNVSNHLACLRECGLVASDKEWRHVRYRLSDPRIGQFLDFADQLLVDIGTEISACQNYEIASSLRDIG